MKISGLITKVCYLGLAIGLYGCGGKANITTANYPSAATATATSTATGSTADIAAGLTYFSGKCQKCHTKEALISKGRVENTTSMTKGTMPPTGTDPTEAQISQLNAYLNSIDSSY